MTKPKKPKLTYFEKLMNEVRRKPSPTIRCRRQLELTDYIAQQAFANLDREIDRTLDGDIEHEPQ